MTTTAQAVAPPPVLEVQNLSIAYRDKDHEQRVVHGVSFAIAPGEVVALVGESGSGKTTTAQALIGLLADNGRVEQGAIRLNGTDIAGWSPDRFDTVRGRVVSLIPQDPTSSLNPVRTVGEQVGEIEPMGETARWVYIRDSEGNLIGLYDDTAAT